MLKKYVWLSPFYAPPETGAGGGGGESTENVAGTSGVAEAAGGGISSGTASDALIRAATASESLSEQAPTESEAAAVARVTGGVTKPATAVVDPNKPAIGAQPATGVETGPVPLDRHKAAITNARAEGAREATEKLAWAKDLDQQSVSTAFRVASSLFSDPAAFVQKLAGELGLTVTKAGAAPQEKAAGDPNRAFPKASLRSEDGKEAYSASEVQEILDISRAKLMSEMDGRLKPLLDDRTRAQDSANQERIITHARETAASALGDARKLPHFQMKDHNGQMVDHPKILANLQAIPTEVRRSIGPIAALYQAYNKFLSEDVFPTLGATAQQQVRDENARKAAASQGAHPTGGGKVAGKTELRTVSDLAKRMEEMATGAIA